MDDVNAQPAEISGLAGASSAPPSLPAWLERTPEEPWCPPGLAAWLPWAGDLSYTDAMSLRAVGPAGWSLLGGTRRGRLHGHRGEFREDAFRIASGDRCFVLVAADGAGSCRLSRIGAELTCRTVTEHVMGALRSDAAGCTGAGEARALLGEVAGAAVARAVNDIVSLANAAGIGAREFRTTVLVAVWWEAPEGELLAVSQVGDGFVAVLRRDGTVQRAGTGDVSEFSGEVSCFLPDAGAIERGRATTVLGAGDITAIVLATDGVEDPFYPIERTGPVLLAQLAAGVTTPAPHFQRQAIHGPVFGPDGDVHLLQWLGFERRGENDDRTLVTAWR